jgi:MFS family permease
MMVPVGRLVILRSVPRQEIVQALATLTIPALVGPVVGPPLGGFITTFFHWRWIFFINIPIGLLGIALSSVFIPNIKEPETPPLDFIGFLLTSIGFSLLMLGLATGGRHLIPIEVSIACGVIGAAALAAYLVHARRTSHPVIKLKLLAIPTFRASIAGGLLFRIGVGAIPFLLPLMLQIGFGLNPLESGSLTFIAAVGALFSKTIAKKILERFGFRRVLTVNAVIGAAFIAANGFFTPATPTALMLSVLFLGGVFRSLQFTSLNAIGYADVSNREMSYATSLSGVSQQLALSIGVALGALALETTAAIHGDANLSPGDFAPAFWMVAAISALASFVFVRLEPNAGAEMSGHQAVIKNPPSTGMGDGLDAS